jgi:hypothetical protein
MAVSAAAAAAAASMEKDPEVPPLASRGTKLYKQLPHLSDKDPKRASLHVGKTAAAPTSASQPPPELSAGDRVLRASKLGLVNLDLAGLALTCLPPDFGLLQRLMRLYVPCNALEAIPAEILQLTNLGMSRYLPGS